MNGSLSCSALNCVHNMGGLCSANIIHVMGNDARRSEGTICNTFAEKGLINSITKLGNTNVAGEFKQLFDSNNVELYPDIKCDAVNCIYNQERMCSAERIQIMGPHASSSRDTMCETFYPDTGNRNS
jgi:hypothetical protein